METRKIPIKFRGRIAFGEKIDGERIIFGSLIDYSEANYGCRYAIRPFNSRCEFPVDTDSVAQLVGYDANGDELYEGDIIILVNDVGEEVGKDRARFRSLFNPSFFYFEKDDVHIGAYYKKI